MGMENLRTDTLNYSFGLAVLHQTDLILSLS